MQKLLLVLSALLLGSCASLLSKYIEKPKVELERVLVRDMDLTSTTLLFVVSVENPNKREIKVDEITYKIFINGRELTQAKTDKAVVIPALSTSEVELPLPVEYNKIWSDLTDLVLAKNAAYRIEGDAKIALLRIPFAKEGKISLRRR